MFTIDIGNVIRMPPQLPPRLPSEASITSTGTDDTVDPPTRHDTVHLTPQASYSRAPTHPYSNPLGLEDPRSSSTQSLRPIESAGEYRRRLLLVYIHGFMGTETSFKSFPAHVHSLLTLMLAESHVVHTKIYPRYQSRKNISFARDAFSNWLYPHESDSTDVVLLGHSLGGILGAEVIILPSHTPGSQNLLQHRVLGLIAFDTPFLGMHPGVIGTGISSLFRGAPEPPQSPGDDMMSMSNPSEVFDASQNDPNYNPAFPNDVHIPVRKNKWERAWYFLNKHGNDLSKATQSYVKSHFEFGGCMADYPGLHKRYDAIRALEDVEELADPKAPNGLPMKRVRFVNYYSASTGRIKEEKTAATKSELVVQTEMQTLNPKPSNALSVSTSQSATPRISLEEDRDGEIISKVEDLDIDDPEPEMTTLEPRHEEDDDTYSGHDAGNKTEPVLDLLQLPEDLPPIPPEPTAPPPFDSNLYTDPEVLKIAQKDYDRQQKAYEKAKKDREKAIKSRAKLISKREKAAAKEHEKLKKQAEQEQSRVDRERVKRENTLNPETQAKQVRQNAQGNSTEPSKKQRDRKFCALPKKDPKTGIRDPTWIRVYMEGVDEVVAHTTLFEVSETYAKLVGDTSERIVEWVNEDATTKALIHERDIGGS